MYLSRNRPRKANKSIITKHEKNRLKLADSKFAPIDARKNPLNSKTKKLHKEITKMVAKMVEYEKTQADKEIIHHGITGNVSEAA